MSLISQSISGSGSLLTGGNRVTGANVHLNALGGEVRLAESATGDHIIRAGFIAFGFRGTKDDGIQRDYWFEPIWINFVDQAFVPPARGDTAENYYYANLVRWYLSLGTTGHLWVDGI